MAIGVAAAARWISLDRVAERGAFIVGFVDDPLYQLECSSRFGHVAALVAVCRVGQSLFNGIQSLTGAPEDD